MMLNTLNQEMVALPEKKRIPMDLSPSQPPLWRHHLWKTMAGLGAENHRCRKLQAVQMIPSADLTHEIEHDHV